MAYGLMALWRMAYGVWRMAYDLCLMAYGVWRVAHALWSMAYGVCVYGQDSADRRYEQAIRPQMCASVHACTCMYACVCLRILACGSGHGGRAMMVGP